MKKLLLPLICFFVLALVSSTGAGMGSWIVGGGAPAASPCPPYYADANVTFSWNGDYTADHNAGCNSSGTKVDDSSDAATTHTDYGEGVSVGVLIEDNDEHITWTDSGDTLINDSIGTVFMRVYVDAKPDAHQTIFEAVYDGTNMLYHTNGSGGDGADFGAYKADGNDDIANGDNPFAKAQWVTLGYSWDQSNGDHTAYGGAGWLEGEDDELGNAFNGNIVEITVGEWRSRITDPGAGHYVWVDRIVILSTYMPALPTNW